MPPPINPTVRDLPPVFMREVFGFLNPAMRRGARFVNRQFNNAFVNFREWYPDRERAEALFYLQHLSKINDTTVGVFAG
jgi:hypothetical protein